MSFLAAGAIVTVCALNVILAAYFTKGQKLGNLKGLLGYPYET